jgi:hypothetical protein
MSVSANLNEQKDSFGPINRQEISGWVIITGDQHYKWGHELGRFAEELIQLNFPIGTYGRHIVMSPLMYEACTLYFQKGNYAELSLPEYLVKMGLNEDKNGR